MPPRTSSPASAKPSERPRARPTRVQRDWLARGLAQPGGKLPLFDGNGQRVSRRTVEACLGAGWCAPWFDNPLKPDWLVCRLTDTGRRALT
ncbi:MAG: hypothetical protein V3R98_09935 [Alphaproteobacteria bacterium]